MAELRLWKFNRITGYWVYQRNVTKETSEPWLTKFQSDEPKEIFIISKSTPKPELGLKLIKLLR